MQDKGGKVQSNVRTRQTTCGNWAHSFSDAAQVNCMWKTHPVAKPQKCTLQLAIP